MNDPHVESLKYSVTLEEHTDYKTAAPLDAETDEFILHLDANSAVFTMKVHCATKEEARALIDSYISRWNILIGLEYSPGELTFRFDRAKIIDRSPSQERGNILKAQSSAHIHVGMDAIVHVSRGKYPNPPGQFKISPDVETMYLRYKGYRKGKETLLPMAYLCLTVLETSAGGRAEAATMYSISKPVLVNLGALCSERGGPGEARKAPKNGKYAPLFGEEQQWIIEVVKALIRRAGEYAYDPEAKLSQLTMGDFPSLP